MKNLVLIGGKLAIICTVAALILALVNGVTAPVIKANREKALLAGLQQVATEAPVAGLSIGPVIETEESGAVISAYPLRDGDGNFAGFILQLVGDGYGGDMQLLAGYEPTGRLFAATLMDNLETPGLGKKAEDPVYMQMFVGAGATVPMPSGRNDLAAAQADAVTGATITFLGVANALTEGAAFSADFRPIALQ